MGCSYLKYQGLGLWARDWEVQVFFFALVRELDRRSSLPPWLQARRQDWLEQIGLGLTGSVCPYLEVEDDEQEAELLRLVEDVVARLETNRPVSREEMNAWGIGGGDWPQTDSAESEYRFGLRLLRLLRGQVGRRKGVDISWNCSVEYQGRAFTVPEWTLESWMYLVSRRIRSLKEEPLLSSAARHWYREATRGGGFYDMRLDGFFPEPDGAAVRRLKGVSEGALEEARSSGASLLEEFNRAGVGRWRHWVALPYGVDVLGVYFLKLLGGEVAASADRPLGLTDLW